MTERFGFEEEFVDAADTEAVVRRLADATDADSIFMNDILLGLGVPQFVVDIPAQGYEEGIEKFDAKAHYGRGSYRLLGSARTVR